MFFTLKLSLLFQFLFLIATNCFSQHLTFSAGLKTSFITGTSRYIYSEKDQSLLFVGNAIIFSPKFYMLEKDNSSFSVETPFGVGLYSGAGYDNSNYFSYTLPVIINYNIGCKSTSDNTKNFGGYFGIGYGYEKISIDRIKYPLFNGVVLGPIFDAGITFGYTVKNIRRYMSVGMSYKKGTEANNFNGITIDLLLIP